MGLEYIRILSKSVFESLIKDTSILEDGDYFFISILDPISTPVLRPDCDNFKSFCFYDVEYDIGNFKKVDDTTLMSLIDFIILNKNKKKVVIHCSAGVSRSGAVGEFIYDNFSIPELTYSLFKKLNKQIVPNIYIKNRLKYLYNK